MAVAACALHVGADPCNTEAVPSSSSSAICRAVYTAEKTEVNRPINRLLEPALLVALQAAMQDEFTAGTSIPGSFSEIDIQERLFRRNLCLTSGSSSRPTA